MSPTWPRPLTTPNLPRPLGHIHHHHRYIVQMLTPAWVLARINGKEQVTVDEIDEVNELFLDAKTSAKILQEQDADFLH